VKTRLITLAFLALTACVGAAFAAPTIIDFSTGAGTDTGTLTYTGGTTPLVGADILIGAVKGVNTPSNSGVSDTITGGLLSFTTGDFVSFDPGTGTYTFGSGGTISITGTGPGCLTVGGCGGNVPNTTSGPTLLSGVDISARYEVASGIGMLDLYITTGSDRKNTNLVQFFGLNPANISSWAFNGTVHATGGGTGGAFAADSTGSTDIANTPVPEPASIILLGSVLVGITSLVHRRRAKSRS
jgi:hypothetical protein